MSTIELDSLRKEFSVSAGTEVAVDGIDLTIREGEFLSLVGPSGCGKTTTLRCIAGLETPTDGAVRINDIDITDVPSNKRNLAMMFQNIALYPHMTVRENIGYPLKIRNVPQGERAEKVERGAEVMQITDMLDKHPGDLSGGQRQRAALARTVVQDPSGFLMDEPLSDLDAKLKIEIRQEIQRVHKTLGKPTLYVTHDQEEAMTMSDRIAVMNDGRIEQVGTPGLLYTKPQNVFVAQFIGNPTMNFLDGKLEDATDDSITVEVEGQTFEFDLADGSEGVAVEEGVKLGIRPETVSLGEPDDDSGFLGEIQLLERTGNEKIATLHGPQGEFQATVSAETTVSEGESVELIVDLGKLHLFDSASGERIECRAKQAAPPTTGA